MNQIEIKFNIDSNKKSQIALLQYICDNLLSEDIQMTSGEIRSMLYDVMDMVN